MRSTLPLNPVHSSLFGALALLAACGGAAASGPVAPRFTMLSRTQAPEPITLLSISAESGAKPGTIIYLDSAGAQQTRSLSEIVALAPPSWVPTPETVAPATDEYGTSDLPVHRLDLTDGERFVGDLADPTARGADALASAAPKSAESLVYLRHDRLGLLAFPLDRVARYWSNARRGAGSRPFSAASDTVLLGNDDRLEGLVTALGPTIAIEVSRPGVKPGAHTPPTPPTEVDIGNAALVNLVNPSVALRSLRIDLDDGTVLAADAVAGDAQSGKITFRPVAAGAGTRGVLTDLSRLAGVVPDPSRIVPLASVPIAAQKPANGRLGATPARALPDAGAPLAAADIVLPGPMTVDWTIPAGATSVIGYAQMDDRSFAWGDCGVVVSVAHVGAPDRELARARLNATSPSLTISAPLGALKPGDVLRVRTEPGERGPIQDRVVLRRMLLLNGPGAN